MESFSILNKPGLLHTRFKYTIHLNLSAHKISNAVGEDVKPIFGFKVGGYRGSVAINRNL